MVTDFNPRRGGAGVFVSRPIVSMRRRALRRISRLIPAVFLMGAVAAPGLVFQAPPACAKGPGTGRSGVVVKYSEANEISRCVALPAAKQGEPEGISGIQALRSLADIEVVTKDYGGDLGEAVCKIGDVGTDDCDFNKGFWAYYHASAGGTWQEAQEGAGKYRLVDGAVDGWAWAPAGTTQAPPKTTRFDEICTKTGTQTLPGGGTPPSKTSSLARWALIGGVIVALLIGTILSRMLRGGAT